MSEGNLSSHTSALQAAQEFVQSQHLPTACLYVVATPIGNLADISLRALAVLSLCDTVYAEDTRVTRNLLQVYGIERAYIARNDAHTEMSMIDDALRRLSAGERIALVSDAGTPAISDPGAAVVEAARKAGFAVHAIPGASSVMALLSVAGIKDTPFCFLGFAPTAAKERKAFCEKLSTAHCTQVFFEGPHRAANLLTLLSQTLNASQPIVIGRELTKRFETVYCLLASDLHEWLQTKPKLDQGEFVIAVGKAANADSHHDLQAGTRLTSEQLLKALLPHLPLKTAVSITHELTAISKNAVYEQALALKAQSQN